MNKDQHQTIYLADYTVPEYLVDTICLTVVLDEKETLVRAESAIRKNPLSTAADSTLFLNGDSIKPLRVCIDGKEIERKRIKTVSGGILISAVPQKCNLEITTKLNPEKNTALSGLYLSSGNFCTQCEAEGFRRITFYPDRPDVLAVFTTRIEAQRAKFPVLLANGNLKEKGQLDGDKHFAVWEDPYPKPCYLFALVAGNLVCIEDHFITKSGRTVALQIYVQKQNSKRCFHAMESLKKAMKWDEDVYGLEYDLDLYMIVAVDDFNMGAMENKGLNVFNSKYVLASPETATDQDYIDIEGVIGHEYFHNWTGNRVTCRDWFQLSLKEGLTVFRDQQFSADMNSAVVQRIDDVTLLRQFQFREDAGPMAHPVRPESYMEINNFYTVTVYNKGAELVRMIHTLIGPDYFKKGLELYFQRHDGQAVTCEDFVAAMSAASSVNLDQFKRWYSQAGTPYLNVEDSWDKASGEYRLKIRQHTEPTPRQGEKKPFHIPVLTGLLKNDPESITSSCKRSGDNFLLELREQEQEFSFSGLKRRPVASLLRTFSAPVRVEPFHSRADLSYLMAHDPDLFNRWDAAFSLAGAIILDCLEEIKEGSQNPEVPGTYVEAVRKNLLDNTLDKALIALALSLPSQSYLAQSMHDIDPDLLQMSHQFVKKKLARLLYNDFLSVYHGNSSGDEYLITPEEIGRRRLRNCCLSYLMSFDQDNDGSCRLCVEHYYKANNMTDQIAALSSISHHQIPEREQLLGHFEKKWINEPLVMDKWFSIQAGSTGRDTLKRVKELTKHPAFSLKNPNKVRSLIGSFSANHHHFHQKDGEGYRFLSEKIRYLDTVNPQIAARLASSFTTWQRYEISRQEQMKEELEKILAKKPLSRDVFEIVKKSLNAQGS